MKALTMMPILLILTISCAGHKKCKESLQDRFRGTTIGSYLGDALGKGVEYVYRKRPDDAPLEYVERRVQSFASRHDSRYEGKWGHHPAGTYTDDTEEMIAVLKSLVSNNGEVIQTNLAKSLGEHFRYNHGYSSKTSKLLKSLKSNPNDWKSIVMTPKRMSYESNGCAMRIAAIGLGSYGMDDNELRDYVYRQCEVTHPAEISKEGAALIAKAIQLSLNYKRGEFSQQDFLQSLQDFCRVKELCKRIDFVKQLVSKELSIEEEVKILRDDKRLGVGFKILNSIPASLYFAAKYYYSFKRALNAAVQTSLTGDADTIPAMTGAILGAYHGQSSFPKVWMEQLYDGSEKWKKRVGANDKTQDTDFISWKLVQQKTDRLYKIVLSKQK